MKYRELDWLRCACGEKKPLRLEEKHVSHRVIDFRSSISFPACRDYCGRAGKSFVEFNEGETVDCLDCLAHEIEEGSLFCEACGREHPIHNAVADFRAESEMDAPSHQAGLKRMEANLVRLIGRRGPKAGEVALVVGGSMEKTLRRAVSSSHEVIFADDDQRMLEELSGETVLSFPGFLYLLAATPPSLPFRKRFFDLAYIALEGDEFEEGGPGLSKIAALMKLLRPGGVLLAAIDLTGIPATLVREIPGRLDYHARVRTKRQNPLTRCLALELAPLIEETPPPSKPPKKERGES